LCTYASEDPQYYSSSQGAVIAPFSLCKLSEVTSGTF
jgi:hypothetical protein